MTRWRRLVRDYEQRLDVSEAMIHVALGSLLLREHRPSMTILKRSLISTGCNFSGRSFGIYRKPANPNDVA